MTPLAFGTVGLLVGLFFTHLYERLYERSFRETERLEIKNQVSDLGTLLLVDLHGHYQTSRLIAGLLEGRMSPASLAPDTRLDDYLTRIFRADDQVKGLIFLRGRSIVSRLSGGDRARRLLDSLASDPALLETIAASSEGREFSLYGPIRGEEGTDWLVLYQTVRSEGGAAASPAWGDLFLLIPFNEHVATIANEAARRGLGLQVEYQQSLVAAPSVYTGDGTWPQESTVAASVDFMGTKWTLAGYPLQGWSSSSPGLWANRALGGVVSILLGVVLYLLKRAPLELRSQVDEASLTLKTTEDRLRRILMSAPVGLLATDKEGQIVLAKGQGLSQLGVDAQSLPGRNLDEVLGELPSESHPSRTSGTEFTIERNNAFFQVRVTERGTGEKSGGVTAVVTDVTASEVAKRTMHASEILLRRLNEITATTEFPLDVKIRKLLELGSEYFGMESGILSRQDGDEFEVIQCAGNHPALRNGARMPFSSTFCSETILHDDPHGIERVVGTEWERHPAYAANGMQAYLGCTVRRGPATYGTISFCSHKPRGEKFSHQDFTFVRLFAEWLSGELVRTQILEKLTSRLEFERLLIAISTRFINLPMSQVREGIEGALADLGRLVNVSCCRVLLKDEGDGSFGSSYVWRGNESPAADALIERLDPEKHRWLMNVLESDGYFSYPSVHVLPLTESLKERLTVQLAHGRSLIVVALQRDGVPQGALVLEGQTGGPEWPHENMPLLQIVAQIVMNLLDRKAAHDQLAVSQQRLDTIVSSLDDVIWSGDPATSRLIYMSPAAEKIYGVPVEEFYRDSRKWHQSVHPEDREKASRYTALLHERGSVSMEYRIVRPNGEVRWVSDRGTLAKDEAGRAVRLDGIVVDITEQKRAEGALLESRQRLQSIIQGAPIILYAVDSSETFTLAEGRGLGDVKQRAESLVGRSIQDVYTGNPVMLRDWRRALGGEVFSTTVEEGGFIFEMRFSHVKGEDGRRRGAVAVGTDITARQLAQEALRESEDRFRRLASATSEGVAILRRGLITDANDVLCHMFGYRRLELIGRSPGDLLAPEFRRDLDEIHSYNNDSLEMLGVRKDGSTFPIEFSERSTLQESIHSRVLVLRDITLQKRALEEFRRAKESAEQAARIKSEFLANMSHEIRTPLNAVLGIADLLAHTNLSPAQREYVGTIRNSGRGLLDVINDILDFSKIEAGKLELESIPFRPSDVLAEVRELLELRAVEKGLHLDTSIDAAVPAAVKGDPARLRQVLLNLINNAIKFTERGGITVHAERAQGDAAEETVIRFSVVDTGIGIPPERLERLFQPFSQVDSSTTRKYGGTGLGLAISRQLVEAMGGGLLATSELGKGSRFSFTVRFGTVADLPITPISLSPDSRAGDVLRTPVPIPSEFARILLVEDNEINQVVAQKMLLQMGHAIDTVANGREALERLRARRYDLVLMDIQMPEMDGYETTREIRRLEGEIRNVPIVAMTANAMKGDAEKCYAAGMDGYVSKPISLDTLRQVLKSYLQDAAPAVSAVPTPKPASPPEEPVVNVGRLVTVLGKDPANHAPVLRLFLKDGEDRMRQLESLLGSGDLARVKLVSHALKGASGNVGADGLARVLGPLEWAAEQGDVAACASSLAEARALFDQVRVFYEDYLGRPGGGA